MFNTSGMVQGPGTSTSDSIPAKLSNNEYVIPAHVVMKKGTDFFDKLLESNAPKGQGMKPSVQNGVIHAAGGTPGGVKTDEVQQPTVTQPSANQLPGGAVDQALAPPPAPDLKVNATPPIRGMRNGMPDYGYGDRHEEPNSTTPVRPKGAGYFGEVARPDGKVSTELTSNFGKGEIPNIVPGLTRSELTNMVDNKFTPETDAKAKSYAAFRQLNGQSPFAGVNDPPQLLPAANGKEKMISDITGATAPTGLGMQKPVEAPASSPSVLDQVGGYASRLKSDFNEGVSDVLNSTANNASTLYHKGLSPLGSRLSEDFMLGANALKDSAGNVGNAVLHGADYQPPASPQAPVPATATATATKPVEAPVAKPVAPIAEKVAANPATAPGNGTPSAPGGMRYQGHKVIPWYNEQDYRNAAYQDGKGPDYDAAQAQMVNARDGGVGGRTQANADRAYAAKVAETQDGIYKDAHNEIFGGTNQSTGKPVPGDIGEVDSNWFTPDGFSDEGQAKAAATFKRHASRLGINQGALDQNRYEFSPDGVVKMYHLNDPKPYFAGPVNQSLKTLQALTHGQ